MTWSALAMGLYAAAVAIPLLLLLYVLKLKRREQFVSSTLLWKRAVQDLQVNAPFQRIRRSLLLFLQLLVLIAVLLALAGPILPLTSGKAQKYVILIDRSASMNATDVAPTRLEEAKKQARIFVETLRDQSMFSLQDSADQAMVFAFDDQARVMCNFTSDKRQLLAAIDAITPSDGASSLMQAVSVAQAFAQASGEEAGVALVHGPAQLHLFSDGRIDDTDQIGLGTDELVFNRIGESADNLAIIAMQARRSYENPDEVNVFATVANYYSDARTCDLQLSINDTVYGIKSVSLPGLTAATEGEGAEPGKVAVNFTLTHPDAGVLEVRQMESDPLGADDAAWSILAPPERLSVLLVSAGNVVLESALRACPLARLDVQSPAEFDALDPAVLNAENPYDIIVLDGHVPGQLPRSRYIVFGPPPGGIDVTTDAMLENQIVVDWRARHPIMKYVNLSNVFAAKAQQMTLPRDADVIAEFNEGPAVALLRRQGSVFLLVGFDVLESNWPFEPGFVLFCYNATNFLGMQVGQTQRSELAVGQPITLEGLTPGSDAQVIGPGDTDESVKATGSGILSFRSTGRVGVYNVQVAEEPARLFAVNLLNGRESYIEPRGEIFFSSETVASREKPISRAHLPIWPYLVAFALVLACVEWWVYNSKTRL